MTRYIDIARVTQATIRDAEYANLSIISLELKLNAQTVCL